MRAVTFLTVLGLALAGCGGDEDEESGGSAGNGVDRAFVAAMIPHHESGIAMAEIAQRRGETDYVKKLAADIVATQKAEIATMRREDAALAEEGVALGTLHAEHSDDAGGLERAEPFDRAFYQSMIPHHEGALAMAREELERGGDPELKALAQDIVDTQQREIREMREHLGAGGAGDHHNP
jgi:uncharacterized protein (DUF305 family)